MRIDLFLKQSRLIPRRTLAQAMCDAGAVTVNGTRAKSAREIHAGDLLGIRYRDHVLTARIDKVPVKPPNKAAAPELYTALQRTPIDHLSGDSGQSGADPTPAFTPAPPTDGETDSGQSGV